MAGVNELSTGSKSSCPRSLTSTSPLPPFTNRLRHSRKHRTWSLDVWPFAARYESNRASKLTLLSLFSCLSIDSRIADTRDREDAQLDASSRLKACAASCIRAGDMTAREWPKLRLRVFSCSETVSASRCEV